jgi:hypothetical protein
VIGLIQGLSGGLIRLFCLTVAESIWVGVAENKETGQRYPAIDLLYPTADLPSVLSIAENMEQIGALPEVYLEQKRGKGYLVVLFRLQPATYDLLEQIAIPGQLQVFESELRNNKNELVMTGETEMESASFNPFLGLFREQGSFRLHLLGQEGKQTSVVWGVRLNEIKDKLPQLV